MNTDQLKKYAMSALCYRISSLPGNQGDKARQLQITQPRLSNLLNGKEECFSLDFLLELAQRAGFKVIMSLEESDEKIINVLCEIANAIDSNDTTKLRDLIDDSNLPAPCRQST